MQVSERETRRSGELFCSLKECSNSRDVLKSREEGKKREMGAVDAAAATVMAAPQSHGRSVDTQAREESRVGGRCNQKLERILLAQQSLRIDILTQKNSDISLHFWFLSKLFRGLNQLRRRGSMTRFRDIPDLSLIQHHLLVKLLGP